MDDFKKAMLIRALPKNIAMTLNLAKSSEDIARHLDNCFSVEGKLIYFE